MYCLKKKWIVRFDFLTLFTFPNICPRSSRQKALGSRIVVIVSLSPYTSPIHSKQFSQRSTVKEGEIFYADPLLRLKGLKTPSVGPNPNPGIEPARIPTQQTSGFTYQQFNWRRLQIFFSPRNSVFFCFKG